MPHRRSVLITYARSNAVDFFDLKMALALKCQRAGNLGYDEPDGRWTSLMNEMAACEFEEDNFILQEKLAAAVNKRLQAPLDAKMEAEEPAAVVAEGLVALDFVKKGIA